MLKRPKPTRLTISLYFIWGFMVGFGQFNHEQRVFRLMLGVIGVEFAWIPLEEVIK